jgi:predicted MFS family arabinose efflux permease
MGYAIGRVPGALIAGAMGDAYGTGSIFLVAGILQWCGILFFLQVPETLKIKKEAI